MAINTNSITAYGLTTFFTLTVVETVFVEDNRSDLLCTIKTNQTPQGSGYQRSLYESTVSINGKTYTIGATKVSHDTVVWSKTISVPHEPDGSKTVSASMRINLGGDILTGAGNVVLTNIPRQSILVLDTNYLEAGGSDLTCSLAIGVATYTHKLECLIDGDVKSSQNLAAGVNSVVFTNSTLSGYLPDNYSGIATIRFELTTYNGSEQVGEVSAAELLFLKGAMPLSIYQNGTVVGVGFGKEAKGEGVDLSNQKINITDSTFEFTEQTGATISRVSGATIRGQEIKKVGNLVVAYLDLSSTTSTASGANYFTGNLSKWLPVSEPISVPQYYGGTCVVCSLWANGNITCRATGGTVPTNAEIKIVWFYPTKE